MHVTGVWEEWESTSDWMGMGGHRIAWHDGSEVLL